MAEVDWSLGMAVVGPKRSLKSKSGGGEEEEEDEEGGIVRLLSFAASREWRLFF